MRAGAQTPPTAASMGSARLARAPELSHRGLVLELDAHQQEEDSHEEVVHELLHGERDLEPPHAHLERQPQDVLDPLVERRVGDDQGEKGRGHHDRRGHGGAPVTDARALLTLQPPHDRRLAEDDPGRDTALTPLLAEEQRLLDDDLGRQGVGGGAEQPRELGGGGVARLVAQLERGARVLIARRDVGGQRALEGLAGTVIEGLEVEVGGLQMSAASWLTCAMENTRLSAQTNSSAATWRRV